MSLATLSPRHSLALRVIRVSARSSSAHEQFFVDPFNVFLVALTAFVGFTTALFSRPYMRIEEHHGRVTPRRLRLYHSMYQLFMTAMLLALLTNNMGLLWVAMEAATLSTVLLVSLYRTRASLEAAWKYFILCGVGIAQALFGTILLYFAAEKMLGREGMTALLWTHLNAVKGQLEPTGAGACVRLSSGRLRHQGRARSAAQLAARRACGRSDARLRGAFRTCYSMSPSTRSSVARCSSRARWSHSSGPMLMRFGLLSAVLACVLSLAATRYQAALRLLLD